MFSLVSKTISRSGDKSAQRKGKFHSMQTDRAGFELPWSSQLFGRYVKMHVSGPCLVNTDTVDLEKLSLLLMAQGRIIC